MEEPDPSSSSAPLIADGSSLLSPSSSGPSTSQVPEEENDQPENEDNDENQNHHTDQQTHDHQRRSSILSYPLNTSTSGTTVLAMRDEVWSCLILLFTFCLFASVILILVSYGSSILQLGPNCSRLIQTNPFFVRSIEVEELEKKPGPVLYGFRKPPPLDVEVNWSESHNTFLPFKYHRRWMFFLNKGSTIDVLFHIKSPSSPTLLLVIAKGGESLVQWTRDPSRPHRTLSWNIIHGSGKIRQAISESSSYYITLKNLNFDDVQVELEFSIKALLYNTTEAYYTCSLGNGPCSLELTLLGTETAVLTSPDHNKDSPTGDDWHVELSNGPRWFTYFTVPGLMTVIILLAFRFCDEFPNGDVNRGESGRAPLLFPKYEDVSSWGSSYDSVSDEEEDLDECGEAGINGEEKNNKVNNPRQLCVICFDAPRDCFFLPCGHRAACFTCGTRILEDVGVCPICRKKTKKVKKIFTV